MPFACKQTLSADSTKSVIANDVKEVTGSSVSDRSVEECGELASTHDQVKQVAENGDMGLYGPEDAPSVIEPVTGRSHAQTFLDKMQSLAFHDTDPGYAPQIIIHVAE